MREYQNRYIENTREITRLSDFFATPVTDFDDWYKQRRLAQQKISQLHEQNMALLNEHLFPLLDNLHDADEQEIKDLEEFAGVLMDWNTNLDCGIYCLIHEALLSMYRVRKDRDLIIKELYMVGMGLYYQNRSVLGVEQQWTHTLRFRNEMIFTEAGSYIRFFDQIDDEQTKGYIIRALANISICTSDTKKKIAVSSRILKILQDHYYRDLAPGLPWDTFLRRTWQQMSSNRNVLSRGNLTTEELAEVLEACQIVFEPEKDNENPNVRWLWPYYEMEYSCGFADLATTMARMEKLISEASPDQHDVSGMYANVQLPVYFGRLLKDNPSAVNNDTVGFLNQAYRKMMKAIMSYPVEQYDNYFFYVITLILTDYYEIPGVESYRSITTALMRRVTGNLYIRSRRVGDLLQLICGFIYDDDPRFFDDIPFLAALEDGAEKKAQLEQYASECGLYHDFGLIKMNVENISFIRSMLEEEFQIYQLHVESGYDDLRSRASTERFADVVLGHHRWYNEAGGYPESYTRNRSPYRQMTDIVAVADYLNENYHGDMEALLQQVTALEHKRFSPLVTAYLHEGRLADELEKILKGDDSRYYREIYDHIVSDRQNS